MADDKRDQWFFKRSQSAIDRRPGGPGQTRQYARTYNVRSETEFTNRPETTSQLREFAILSELERDRRRRRENDAQSRVHVFPSVGKFIVPEHKDNWAVNLGMIKDASQNLGFSPERYVYFDKIIAEKLGKDSPAINPKHPDHARYEGLRNNLAVMRNKIISFYLDDGSFDPGDEKYIPNIVGTATALGDALAGDKWYKRPFAPTVSIDVANVEGVGAHEMYNYLLSMQSKPAGKLEELRQRINAAFGFSHYAWGLPPIEKTPFSLDHLAAPLPQSDPAPAAVASAEGHDQLLGLSHAAMLAAGATQYVDTLIPPAREASVEDARAILRWLRNLRFSDRDMEEWLSHGTPPERMAKAEAVTQLVEAHAGLLYHATRKQPELMHDMTVEDAGAAAGAMARSLATHALNTLPDGHPAIGELETLLSTMPPAWEHRATQSVSQLFDTLETGLAAATGAGISEKSPAERLLEVSGRITAAAYQLRSVADMREPAREESVELAREILRRLKNLKSSDMPVEELVSHGTPEDKAAFAQKIGEMAEMYRNLLAEAAQTAPGIANDPRVREAGDAVGSFAHIIKLMAAKEIPSSIAAAQQISADVTQMPEEWKKLDGRTVGRLVASMEGGLESAVGELAAEQQEQQQDEPAVNQESLDTHLHGHRRRRRRRQRSAAATARKAHKDITADDYVLKQGRFREEGGVRPNPAAADKPVAPAISGLSESDLAAIRNLGNNLRDIGNQAGALPAAPVDEKIAPDDKTLAAREQDQRNNPRRPRERM